MEDDEFPVRLLPHDEPVLRRSYAFDDSPAWEDITAQVAINRVYNFLNESKTAEKWGVNVRFTITKNEGYEEEVSISGFGGAYE